MAVPDPGRPEVVGVGVGLIHRAQLECPWDGRPTATASSCAAGRGKGGGQLSLALSLQPLHQPFGVGLVGVQLVHQALGRNQLGVEGVLLARQLGPDRLLTGLELLQGVLFRLEEVALIVDRRDEIGVGLGHVVHDLQAIGEIRE